MSLNICVLFGLNFNIFIVFADIQSAVTLTPYRGSHGSRLDYRSIRECQHQQFGVAPHEIYPSHHSWNLTSPYVQIKRFVKEMKSDFRTKVVRGHYVIVSNPTKTISVFEPGTTGGCDSKSRDTVTETAKTRNCIVALNAGYFNTKTGECLGNVISDGRKAHYSGGIQNVHFGLKSEGSIFTGYVSEEDFHNESKNFLQLVGGVVWLIRNGSNFVNTSKFLECESTEETGTMDAFVDVLSARTAVGHDSNGRVILVNVEGKSSIDGISLWEFQDILKSFDVVNAINLDGGGSSTFLVNGTVVNYPYDECPEHGFNCERKVSTILCVHPPYCVPADCNGHGQCVDGKCECHPHWLPPSCDRLICLQSNCSLHGNCTTKGCICEPGFHGENCEKAEKFNIRDILKPYLSNENSEEGRKWNLTMITLSVVTAVSVASSLLLLFYSCSCYCKNRQNLCCKRKRQKYRNLSSLASDIALSDSSDSDSLTLRHMEKS